FLDARDIDITVPIGKLKFAVSIVVAAYIDSLVINTNLFLRRGVVVNQHLARPNNCHSANFVGVEPARVYKRHYVTGEVEGEQRDVFFTGSIMTIAMAAHPFRHLTQKHKDDRNVMCSQIPHHVYMMLKQAQVGSNGGNIQYLSKLA